MKMCSTPPDESLVLVEVGDERMMVALPAVETWARDYFILHNMSVWPIDCSRAENAVAARVRVDLPGTFVLFQNE